ncbi:MAG: TerB family tellurite resistance protein [Candidatus Zixiibacteriota bacterium]
MWDHKMIESSLGVFEDTEVSENYMGRFFINRDTKPLTAAEKQTIDEFNMITSAMAIMIYIAEKDDEMEKEEHDIIIEQMFFQLKQRHKEYDELSEKYGRKEREIAQKVFDKLMKRYKKEGLHIDQIIKSINIVFKNNPYSKNFILRLCYYTALADNCLEQPEMEAIDKIAAQMHISPSEHERIKLEVADELGMDGENLC